MNADKLPNMKALHDAMASVDRFLKYSETPESTLSTMVLKWHLLIEEQLDGILKDALGISHLPTENRLEFDQKYYLVRQILVDNVHPNINPDLVVPVKTLNRFRNKMAHNLLEEKDFNDSLNCLFAAIKESTKSTPKKGDTIEEKLGSALRKTYLYLVKTRMWLAEKPRST